MFLKFKQKTQYELNWHFLVNRPLKLAPESHNPFNKSEVLLGDFIFIMHEKKNYNFETPLIPKHNCVEVKIDEDTYFFQKTDESQYLEVMLHLIKQAGTIESLTNGRWLFIERDSVKDDPHFFYQFFICNGLNIVVENISLSVTFPNSNIMNNIIIETKNDDFFVNEKDDRRALVRLCYDKWQSETVPGKIYAMKQRIEMEEEMKEESGVGLTTGENININILNELKNMKSYIKGIYIIGIIICVFIILSRFFR